MSAAGPKEAVPNLSREPDLDIYDKLRRFDEKLKELEARLAPRVPSHNGSGTSPGAPQPPTESISDRNARIDNDMRNIELGRDEGPAGGCPEEES